MRKVIAAIGVACLLAVAPLPPEHVHAGSGDHSEVVHRHFQNHSPADHHHSDSDHDDGDHDSSVGDHDHGDDVKWLSTSFVRPEASQFHPLQASLIQFVTFAPTQPSHSRPPAPEASAHDPPWTRFVGLRAPPALSV